MRPKQPKGEIGPAHAALLALENQWSANVKATREEEPRVYPWRPSGLPELPSIWNWIDDGDYEIVDTHRGDDDLVMRVTIGIKPSDLQEAGNKLVSLMDIFRATVDPALVENQPLGGTVREAKRVVTRTADEVFGTTPVLCIESLIRMKLSAAIR